MMNKYEIRTQKKKEAIMCAALQLFRKKGYTRTSINEIASVSGVSSVSIYNYYDAKENLVKECAQVLLNDTMQKAVELLSSDLSFRDKLANAISLCVEKPHQLMDEYFSVEALNDAVFMELLRGRAQEIRSDIIHSFIECGKVEGTIDPSLSTEIIIHFLDAVSAIQDKWETQSEHREKAGEISKLMLYGLIGR